jgi:hypothetical protein
MTIKSTRGAFELAMVMVVVDSDHNAGPSRVFKPRTGADEL